MQFAVHGVLPAAHIKLNRYMVKDIAPVMAFLLSMVTLTLVHPLLVRFALDKDIVDKPNARRLNRVPIPVLGGVGIFVSSLVACSVYGILTGVFPSIATFISLLVILCMGVLDDIRDLKPKTKFITQIAVVLFLVLYEGLQIDNLHGVFGIYEIPAYVSLPLTVLSCVGLVNAMNLIDGIDGLSSGFCILAGVICYLFAMVQGNVVNACMAVSVIGALVPFFYFNVFGKKQKMFIGDSGSHFLGMLFAVMIMNTIHSYTPGDTTINNGIMAFTLAVMAHPVMDTLRVMTMRMLKGVSPFKADKSHLHHVIVALGLSHLRTTLLIVSLNLMVVAAWYTAFISGASPTVQFLSTLSAAVVCIMAPYFVAVKCLEKKSKTVS